MNKIGMIVGGAVVSVLIVCVTVLVAMEKPTDGILAVVGVGVVPFLGALIHSKISGLERTTEAVRQQTNGRDTQQMDFMREVMREVMTKQRLPQPETGDTPAQ